MSSYIEYQLEDGTTVLVETDQPQTGVTRASRDRAGNIITSVNQSFEYAFAGVKKSAQALRQQLEEMRADEVEVSFGLKAVGEAGNFAIAKAGVEANYMVKLKWSGEKREKKE
jgi:hypothetical protein